MSERLLKAIQSVSWAAVQAGAPTGIYYGTVTSETPLKILVEQKMELTEEFLVLSGAVRDRKVELTLAVGTMETEDASFPTSHTHPCDAQSTVGSASFDSAHRHRLEGRKQVLLHLALRTGEKVILLRMQGGQKFLVLDRLGEGETT